MKSKLLLPPQFKIPGILFLIPSVILGYLYRYHEFSFSFLFTGYSKEDSLFDSKNYNLTDELALTGIIVGLLMIAFSRIKQEDEFIHFIRLESWQWAVVVNFFLLIVATWIFYGDNYFDVMIYNMLTIPILFIIRFQYLLFRAKKAEARTYTV